MSTHPIISRLAAPSRMPLIGKVVAWSIGRIAVSRERLIELAEQAGLDARHVPRAIRTRSCLMRTLDALVEEGFIRRVAEDAHRAVFVLVAEHVDPARLDVRYSVETRFEFDKAAKTVTCGDPAVQARIDALMSHFATAFLPSDVRRFILDAIKAAGGITLRDKGGVYLVPPQRFEVVEALDRFIRALGPSCSLMCLNIPETEADLAQVFRSFEAEFLDELEAMGRELGGLEADADRVRTATWLNRLRAFQAQREKALMFCELLAVESGRYTHRITALEARIRDRLNA